MKKILLFVEEKLVLPMEKISRQRHLIAIRDGLLAVFPLSLIGSMFYLIATLPLPETWGLQQFLTKNANTILVPYRMTVVLITLYMVVGVGANLAKSYRYNQVSGALVSLAAFLMTNMPANPSAMIPQYFLQSAAEQGMDTSWFQSLLDLGWVMPQTPMSGIGVYVGALSAVIGVETLRFSKKIARKVRKAPLVKKTQVPDSVLQTVETIAPIFMVVLFFWIVRDIIGFDFQQAVLAMFGVLIRSSTTLPGALFYVLILSFASFFGLIGFGVQNSAASITWKALIAANAAAYVAGTALPNVTTLPFFHYFVWIGGTGAMLSLVFLMCFSKFGYLRKLGLSSLLPALANINQPALYGFPVILNPYMFIPFILGPQVTTVVTYICMKINLVGRPHADPANALPFAIGAFISTGDWKAILLSILNFFICVVIYYPFFKAYEKKLIAEGEERAQEHALEENKKLKVTTVE